MSEYCKLEPEFKKKWLAALRSGDYDQGRDVLRRVEGGRAVYCCLGVAAEVIHGKGVWSPGFRNRFLCATSDDSSTYFLPPFLLPPPEMEYPFSEPGRYATEHVMAMNDREQKSFEEIADWIEENL